MPLLQKIGSDDREGGRRPLRAWSLLSLICFRHCTDALLLGGGIRMTWGRARTCEPMEYHEDGGELVQLGQCV